MSTVRDSFGQWATSDQTESITSRIPLRHRMFRAFCYAPTGSTSAPTASSMFYDSEPGEAAGGRQRVSHRD